jgi:hypothetical protein
MRLKIFLLALLVALLLISCNTAMATSLNDLTIMPSPTPTFIILTKPAMIATPSQIPISPKPSPTVNISVEESVSSPSGKWLARVIIAKGDSDTNSSKLIVVDQQNFTERTIEKNNFTSWLGYSMPWPLAWSESEDYLYYTHRFGGGDGCFGENDFLGTDLYKFDLMKSKVVQLAPKLGYWLALSPNQTLIAYLANTNILKVRNIETGKEVEISISEQAKYSEPTLTHASHLVWSPDGKELLVTFEVNVCGMEDDAKNSIIKVGLETLSQELLVSEDPNRPQTIAWLENNKALVQDENGIYWWLDPFTGQMLMKK